MLSASWYPVGAWNRVLATVLSRFPLAARDHEMRKIAAFIAEHDLNGVYKMILRLGSPELLLRRSDSLWTRYFDTGRLHWQEDGTQRFRLSLESTGASEMPDRFTCDPGVCAWLETGLRMTGVQGSVVHHDCRLTNGSRCEYSVTW